MRFRGAVAPASEFASGLAAEHETSVQSAIAIRTAPTPGKPPRCSSFIVASKKRILVAEILRHPGIKLDELIGIESSAARAVGRTRRWTGGGAGRLFDLIEHGFVMSRWFPDERSQPATIRGIENDVVELRSEEHTS